MRYAVVWSETNGYPLIAVESYNKAVDWYSSSIQLYWWINWYSLRRDDGFTIRLQNIYGFKTKEEADNALLDLQSSIHFIGGFNDSTD